MAKSKSPVRKSKSSSSTKTKAFSSERTAAKQSKADLQVAPLEGNAQAASNFKWPAHQGPGQTFIGISGWTYADWRGGFYPKGVSQKKELEYCSRQLNSVEINGTFYAIQKPASFNAWYAATPENFVFAVKANKYITHIRRLKDVEIPLANFLASGVLRLGDKLGPLLWQFPPTLTLKDDRFEKFLKLLPRDFDQAIEIAKKQTFGIEGGLPTSDKNYPLRHAFEFRHPSFFQTSEFTDMLRHYNVAVVFGHSGENNPYVEDVTSDFIYARMHGQEKRFKKGYTEDFLFEYSKRIETWVSGGQPADAIMMSPRLPEKKPRDTFIYFDTECKSAAPNDARMMMKLMDIKAAA